MNDVTTQLSATDFQENSTSTFQLQISLFHHKKAFLCLSKNFG